MRYRTVSNTRNPVDQGRAPNRVFGDGSIAQQFDREKTQQQMSGSYTGVTKECRIDAAADPNKVEHKKARMINIGSLKIPTIATTRATKPISSIVIESLG
jgi:hypothetical protein